MSITERTTSYQPDTVSIEPAAPAPHNWQKIALGLIILLSAVLNFWSLDQQGYSNTYYSAAVRSMMQNWHAFFFASFDSAGFVTVDKPPLGLWFQVLSAKIFGYSAVSLMLPEALAGVVAVVLMYYIVRRFFETEAALLAALVLATTPVSVVVSRNNIIDSVLILMLMLGAWAITRAMDTGRLRWLLLSAVFVGLGFNVKMLQAFLVVPAFGLAYLLGSHHTWLKRIGHLVLALVLLLVVSLSWCVAVDLTPASQRPWVDSTQTNSELDLALGYNGLQRLLGMGFGRGGSGGQPPNRNNQSTAATTSNSNASNQQANTNNGAPPANQQGQTNANNGAPAGNQQGQANGNNGAPPSFPSGGSGQQGQGGAGSQQGRDRFGGPGGGGPGGGGGMFGTGQAGLLRLFNVSDMAEQTSWLLPLALIGLIIAASQGKVRLPLTKRQQGIVLWGMWLLTTAIFFSVAGFFHTYYLATMAPSIAALTGIGIVALWRDYRSGGWRRWLLPFTLVVTAAVQIYMLSSFQTWNSILTPIVAGLCILGALGLILAAVLPRIRMRMLPQWAVMVGVIALLVVPSVWSGLAVIQHNGGLTPAAGPSGFGGFGRGGGPGGDVQVNQKLLQYLEAHQSNATYLFATTNSQSAAPYIITTGKTVMSIGGFSGSDPTLTTQQLAQLVKNGTVRYFLMGGGGGPGGGSSGVASWVQSNCSVVPTSQWQTTSASNNGQGGFGQGGPGFGGGGTLYDCSSSK
ncbi:MAG TPA: glycosyltransferase family 39 protein [Ktedonobacteraceae bacterium]|nr:glycosyltransferase family 39 protein [Ktedonobacteraceae bacterium]